MTLTHHSWRSFSSASITIRPNTRWNKSALVFQSRGRRAPLAGCWHAEPTRLDRSGRVLGVIWILTFAVIRSAGCNELTENGRSEIGQRKTLMHLPQVRFGTV